MFSHDRLQNPERSILFCVCTLRYSVYYHTALIHKWITDFIFLESVSVYYISIKIDAADRFSFRLSDPEGYFSSFIVIIFYISPRLFLVENVFRAVGTDK